MFLVKRMNDGSRREGHARLAVLARWGNVVALVFLCCFRSDAQVTEPAQMFERMRSNFLLESGASIGNRIEAEVTWRLEKDGPALRSGRVVDQWLVLSDGERYGTERFRQSPDGDRKTRTVYLDEERREFEFDLTVSDEVAVAGKLSIRHGFGRGPYIRLPLLNYLDRLCGPPGRFGFGYKALADKGQLVEVDGHPCHEITGEWNGRIFTFWLDPEFGCLPRRYTIQVTHASEASSRRRGWRDSRDERLLAPPPVIDQNTIPVRTEELLSVTELARQSGHFVIETAVLERTQYFDGGSVCSERIILKTGDYASDGRLDIPGFLEFKGLMRDGTPVQEYWPEPGNAPDSVERYTLTGGQRLPASRSFKDYLGDLREDLGRLGRDFSLQNLQRIDSKFLIAVCAIAALLINGGIAYASYRKNRTKPS
ncbi:MAG: hypothetical protein JNK74_20670 [Candidatus Hydrogenedentes bacterium]|nr:hypothetical protein [Candidatus Hydrogenedentota bacterium]